MLLVFLSASAVPASASGVKVKVYSSSARFYSSASSSAASLRLPKGLSLTLTGVSGKWAKVRYKGHTGYMALSSLNTAKRYAAYVKKNTYLYSRASTSSKKVSVGVNTKVYIVGRSGRFYRVQNSRGVTAYVKASCLSRKKVRSATSWKSKVVKLNWFRSGKYLLKRDSYGYLYDIKTGISLRIKCMGGTNHADVEPVTKADTYKLYKICGGKYSWDSRACILYTKGKYVACAINTMPHGDQTLTHNGYNGQFCLHMTGSLTHGTSSTNKEHQRAIRKAYNWAH